jgi:uncharacterized protein (DUF927 family)
MDGHLYNYVRACIEESALLRKAVDVPIQFGWQKDRSFVYNNRVFRRDGSEIPVPMPGLENINRGTSSKGTIEGWRKPWQLLIDKKMDTMLAMCLDSFGSPLMSFSDYEGFVWHIGSTGSGTGKSLTLSLKAGVWGHPIRYRTGKGTSPVAMQQRAGLLNSMPAPPLYMPFLLLYPSGYLFRILYSKIRRYGIRVSSIYSCANFIRHPTTGLKSIVKNHVVVEPLSN